MPTTNKKRKAGAGYDQSGGSDFDADLYNAARLYTSQGDGGGGSAMDDGSTITTTGSSRKTHDGKSDGPARNFMNDKWAENPRLTMLVNSLSSRVRYFAMYEWFYATIDRDYFNHNEFQDCLEHMGLSNISKLTR